MPRPRLGAPFAANAPRPVHLVLAVPAVLFRELLDPQVCDHGPNLLFPPRAPCPAESAHSKSRRVIGVVWDAGVAHSERTIRSCVIPDERDGPANFRARQRVDPLRHLE